MTPFRAVDPRQGLSIGPTFLETTDAEVDAAVAATGEAQTWFADAPVHQIESLLHAIRARIDELGDALIEVADTETALGPARLTAERDRTCDQLRRMAAWVLAGRHLEVIITTADVSTTTRRPDLRRMMVPLGPVAVFGASNFPLAFGAAGGDTAAALAAGCPVVFKSHPSHPGTSKLVAAAVSAAVADCDAPAGVFSLVQGDSPAPGTRLVQAPGISAVAFTGSRRVGRHLFDLAAARPDPIPVYAEMGSVNPIFITSDAFAARGDAIAAGVAAAVGGNEGQLCTKPGVVFVAGEAAAARLADDLVAAFATRSAGPMLNRTLRDALSARVNQTRGIAGVRMRGVPIDTVPTSYPATVVEVARDAFLAEPDLWEEHFGPVVLVVGCESSADFALVARKLPGSLAAALHAEEAELDALRAFHTALLARVGRVIWNGYPTGVTVSEAMTHGGPYPATTAPGFTAVGATSTRRFQRPVTYQDAPDAALPAPLHRDNPLRLERLVDGEVTTRPA